MITAGHCCIQAEDPAQLSFYVGQTEKFKFTLESFHFGFDKFQEQGGPHFERYFADDWIIHQNFDIMTFTNDICIVLTTKRIRFNAHVQVMSFNDELK